MKIETLKKDNLNRNIVIGVFGVLIISALVLNFTRAKYRSTASVPIVDSEVNYVRPDLDIVAIVVDGETVTSLNTNKQYTLDTSQSTCTYKDGSTIDNLTLNYDSETKAFSIYPYTTRGTKCYLYFDEVKGQSVQDILAGKSISTRSSFSTVLTDDTTGIIYQATDDDGTTYYYSGAPTDNWVYFAGFYWRIIRVNGDGTIRLIYAGSSTNISREDDQIGTSYFNSSHDRSEHVGMKYTEGSQYGTNENSTIYTILNTWYTTNISDKGYSGYIDTNAGFCGDRDMASGSTWSSQPDSTIYYAAWGRLNTNKSPVFTCSTNNLYTYTLSNKGNKSLSNPIGLITADEVTYAGGVNEQTNEDYYLYTGNDYWTMSPYFFYGGNAYMFHVYSNGNLSYFINVVNTLGIRPVINLRADTQFQEGTTGTATNPFVVV